MNLGEELGSGGSIVYNEFSSTGSSVASSMSTVHPADCHGPVKAWTKKKKMEKREVLHIYRWVRM